MEIGWIGLGKMGWNLCLNLLDHGFDITVYNRDNEKSREMVSFGAGMAFSIENLVEKLDSPRIIWIMVTQGTAVDDIIGELEKHLDKGDIIVDGGNSHYKDSIRRAKALNANEIEFVDVGTSGGITGARRGACMMVGGTEKAYVRIQPVLEALCMPNGYGYIGTYGSGHYVKMIHNGIEYGMMQAMGEGFEIMEKSDYYINFEALTEIWNNGSIIEGYLMETMKNAFVVHGDLSGIIGKVDASGEGRWTVEEALEKKVSAPVISLSLLERYRSMKEETYSGKVLAALRNVFGGHPIHEK
ncbi:MAG TPA: decarboxylating 6-phosphogluconate dehydrogenase [Clostridia bacterium]|nr:decarboxylating 6-phosphogluconate dehydrogenase [Clostridia bacterium]